jgi:nucleoside-diphosphate-sugar epimerase
MSDSSNFPPPRDKTLLVTGGAGFIGSALTKALCDTNRIRIFDNLRRNALADTGLDKHPNV